MAIAPTKIEVLTGAFRSFGYVVMADPIEGEEDKFAAHLKEGLDRIEETMRVHARRHGFRGRSKRALAALHRSLPSPVWGVEVID